MSINNDNEKENGDLDKVLKNMTRDVNDECRSVHPALDFIEGISVVGFRERKRVDGKFTSTNSYLVFSPNQIIKQSSLEVVSEGKSMYIDDDGKLLVNLDEKLTRNNVKQLLDNPTVSAKETYQNTKGVFKKFFYLSSDLEYHLITAWTIGTYFHRLFFSYPFLHIKAPKASGKSQLLSCLHKLCFNASKGRPTVASLGDIISGTRGTILYDQADSLHNDNNYEIREILTDSYKIDGGKRRVMDMSKGRKILEFETYSPKAFASTIELPEDLKDRCLLIPIVRTHEVYPTPDDQNADWSNYRTDIYSLLRNGKEVKQILIKLNEEYKTTKKLIGRELDLWLPIETIMRFCEVPVDTIEETQKYYQQLAKYMTFYPKDKEQEIIAYLLTRFVTTDIVLLSVKEITRDLLSRIDIVANLDNDSRGESWNDRKVGWAINNYNLSSNKKRRNDGIYYEFELEKIKNISRQYFESNDDVISSEEPNSV
ncbi:MAG: hypothetical protein WCJ70_04585 [bacterium]